MSGIDISNRIPTLFDPYVLAFMGIILEVFAALFLSFESIGKSRFLQMFDALRRFSKWLKKSFLRMTIFIIPVLLVLTLGIIFNLKIVIGLFFPVLIILSFLSLVIDHPDYYEKWIIKKSREGTIGPIGFIILAFGGLLQMISLLWQMSLNN